MPPAALIGAYEPGPAAGGLRALLPFAGATLVEHQARRAAAIGAAPVLLLVDEVPPELAEVAARLRRDGVDARLVDGLDAAIEALPPERPLLLIVDACLPPAELLRDLAAVPVPAVATLADGDGMARHERIDADTRWAGVALIDRPRLIEAAAMLGSWDPVSTLLRRAVQEGAARVAADAMPPTLILEPAAAAEAERVVLAQTRRRPRDWVTRWLHGPAIEAALSWLVARRAEGWWFATGALGLVVAGGVLGIAAWPRTALVALLLGGAGAALARRLADIDGEALWLDRVLPRARIGAAALGFAGLCGILVAQTAQWGWWLAGALVPAAMAALWRQRRLAEPQPLWLASLDGLQWALLPFAVAGRWEAGIAMLALYACLSFAVVQRATT